VGLDDPTFVQPDRPMSAIGGSCCSAEVPYRKDAQPAAQVRDTDGQLHAEGVHDARRRQEAAVSSGTAAGHRQLRPASPSGPSARTSACSPVRPPRCPSPAAKSVRAGRSRQTSTHPETRGGSLRGGVTVCNRTSRVPLELAAGGTDNWPYLGRRQILAADRPLRPAPLTGRRPQPCQARPLIPSADSEHHPFSSSHRRHWAACDLSRVGSADPTRELSRTTLSRPSSRQSP
jgi:hypothetical protein